MTSNLEPVSDQADVPFSLPHVSEMEMTPRDARKEAGKLITMPAFGSIKPDEAGRAHNRFCGQPGID